MTNYTFSWYGNIMWAKVEGYKISDSRATSLHSYYWYFQLFLHQNEDVKRFAWATPYALTAIDSNHDGLSWDVSLLKSFMEVNGG